MNYVVWHFWLSIHMNYLICMSKTVFYNCTILQLNYRYWILYCMYVLRMDTDRVRNIISKNNETAKSKKKIKVAKSGALAPKWRFWNSLWRQKKFGALWRIKKNLQKKLFPVNILKNHWEILDLGYLEKIIR